VSHTANPFDHAGTVDTSNYGAPTQSEAFGASGTSIDPGQVTPGARTTVTGSSVATVVAALDADANLTTVASDRAAWLVEVNPYARQSLVR
jgi:hypothetical protein